MLSFDQNVDINTIIFSPYKHLMLNALHRSVLITDGLLTFHTSKSNIQPVATNLTNDSPFHVSLNLTVLQMGSSVPDNASSNVKVNASSLEGSVSRVVG